MEGALPSVSAKQAKLMRIAAHTKGGYGGVPQKVGKDFEAADEAKAKKKSMSSKMYGAKEK